MVEVSLKFYLKYKKFEQEYGFYIVEGFGIICFVLLYVGLEYKVVG